MSRSQTTQLYLVRHGETDWNREQRLQGVLDVPLNDAGTAQAHRLADQFVGVSIACVVSSPLTRAAATAAILAKACACPLEIDPRVREIDHGSWSGLTLPDIRQRFPPFVRNEQLTPAAFDVSGGEHLSDVQRRVRELLTDLLERRAGQSVLVVGHGITLALMCCDANGVDILRFQEHLPPNAAVVVLTFSQDRLVGARTMDAAGTAVRSDVER